MLDAGQDLPRLRQQHRAGGGQLHAAAVALEQRHAQLRLELADLLTQRRLGDVQTLGRTPEVRLLRDRDEVAEVAELHAGYAVAWSRPMPSASCCSGTPNASTSSARVRAQLARRAR